MNPIERIIEAAKDNKLTILKNLSTNNPDIDTFREMINDLKESGEFKYLCGVQKGHLKTGLDRLCDGDHIINELSKTEDLKPTGPYILLSEDYGTGLLNHADQWTVLHINFGGTCEWSFYDDPQAHPYMSIYLEPGDGLWMPYDMYHSTKSLDVPRYGMAITFHSLGQGVL